MLRHAAAKVVRDRCRWVAKHVAVQERQTTSDELLAEFMLSSCANEWLTNGMCSREDEDFRAAVPSGDVARVCRWPAESKYCTTTASHQPTNLSKSAPIN
jgi:hypothetical protein